MPARPDAIYRDAVRWSHRLLGCYLALCAWTRDLDCVVLDKEDYFGNIRSTERELFDAECAKHNVKFDMAGEENE